MQSDVWSLGLSLVELAIGLYPIPPPSQKQLAKIFGPAYDSSLDTSSADPSSPGYNMASPYGSNRHSSSAASGESSDATPSLSIFALLDYIVIEPPPSVPLGVFTPEFKDFVDSCLKKEPHERPDLNGLMVSAGLALLPFLMTHLLYSISIESSLHQAFRAGIS